MARLWLSVKEICQWVEKKDNIKYDTRWQQTKQISSKYLLQLTYSDLNYADDFVLVDTSHDWMQMMTEGVFIKVNKLSCVRMSVDARQWFQMTAVMTKK